MRPLPYLAITLLVVACERQPAAPDRTPGPLFQATRSEVTDTFDFVDDPADCTANPKIGEIVLFTGRVTRVLSTTTASSGSMGETGFFTYDPADHLMGQTSGSVWMIDVASTHSMFHDNIHGAGESFAAVDYEDYTNANGARLRLRIHWHLTVSGNGTVVLDRLGPWECSGG
jgi:hypothetical protein